MQFRTEIGAIKITPKISYRDKIFSIGSCFSNEMADRLKVLKYSVCQNPSGITFNPVSIADTIKMIKYGNSLPEEELILSETIWCHPSFHSSFNHIHKDTYISNTSKSLASARAFLSKGNWAILTTGTAFVYEHKRTRRIANNCHKLPSNLFHKRLLEVSEIVESLNNAISEMEALSENVLNTLLTVSPVRHTREGLHENQLSKARCLLAVHEVCQNRKNVHYFPSYEIMLDDLRDYRFYREDMIHPTLQASNYIFESFEEAVMNQNEKDIRTDVQKINRALNHKALNPASEAHRKFLMKLESDIKRFQEENGDLGIQFN